MSSETPVFYKHGVQSEEPGIFGPQLSHCMTAQPRVPCLSIAPIHGLLSSGTSCDPQCPSKEDYPGLNPTLESTAYCQSPQIPTSRQQMLPPSALAGGALGVVCTPESVSSHERKDTVLIALLKDHSHFHCIDPRTKTQTQPWLVWLSGLSTSLGNKESLAPFPVRAHAWVAGQVPSRGRVRSNHTLMFLSSSLPL